MSRIIVGSVLGAAVYAVVAAIPVAAGRELTQEEMWMTFGGVNMKRCVLKEDCYIDPQNCNSDYAEKGEAECLISEHDVKRDSDGKECKGTFLGWDCSDTADVPCRMTLYCEWEDGECSQEAYPGGWKGGADGPDECNETEP